MKKKNEQTPQKRMMMMMLLFWYHFIWDTWFDLLVCSCLLLVVGCLI